MPALSLGRLAATALTALAIAIPAAARAELDDATGAALDKALAGAHRSEQNKARDRFRHPKETLAFFGLAQGQTVVEVWPGSGWYTEVLAPVLKEKGRYIAASWDKDSPASYVRTGLDRYAAKLAATPEQYSQVTVTEFGPKKPELAPPGSADLVLTFRNVHNWMADGWAEDAFKAMYAALKPGGVLGVVEHRAPDSQPQDPKAASGYVRQDHVVKLAEAAGFKLDATSEINANPKDGKDHPKGVWTLPPTLALKEQDRDKYLAIGESDRMTLRFIKPAS